MTPLLNERGGHEARQLITAQPVFSSTSEISTTSPHLQVLDITKVAWIALTGVGELVGTGVQVAITTGFVGAEANVVAGGLVVVGGDAVAMAIESAFSSDGALAFVQADAMITIPIRRMTLE